VGGRYGGKGLTVGNVGREIGRQVRDVEIHVGLIRLRDIERRKVLSVGSEEKRGRGGFVRRRGTNFGRGDFGRAVKVARVFVFVFVFTSSGIKIGICFIAVAGRGLARPGFVVVIVVVAVLWLWRVRLSLRSLLALLLFSNCTVVWRVRDGSSVTWRGAGKDEGKGELRKGEKWRGKDALAFLEGGDFEDKAEEALRLEERDLDIEREGAALEDGRCLREPKSESDSSVSSILGKMVLNLKEDQRGDEAKTKEGETDGDGWI
jgi:hypothetical protein